MREEVESGGEMKWEVVEERGDRGERGHVNRRAEHFGSQMKTDGAQKSDPKPAKLPANQTFFREGLKSYP